VVSIQAPRIRMMCKLDSRCLHSIFVQFQDNEDETRQDENKQKEKSFTESVWSPEVHRSVYEKNGKVLMKPR